MRDWGIYNGGMRGNLVKLKGNVCLREYLKTYFAEE